MEKKGESGLGRSTEETFSGFQKHHSKLSKAKLLLWPLGMTLYDDSPFYKRNAFFSDSFINVCNTDD